jgi:hypothetical protein
LVVGDREDVYSTAPGFASPLAIVRQFCEIGLTMSGKTGCVNRGNPEIGYRKT